MIEKTQPNVNPNFTYFEGILDPKSLNEPKQSNAEAITHIFAIGTKIRAETSIPIFAKVFLSKKQPISQSAKKAIKIPIKTTPAPKRAEPTPTELLSINNTSYIFLILKEYRKPKHFRRTYSLPLNFLLVSLLHR